MKGNATDSGWKLGASQACAWSFRRKLHSHLSFANDAKLRPSHPSLATAAGHWARLRWKETFSTLAGPRSILRLSSYTVACGKSVVVMYSPRPVRRKVM